MGIEERYLNIIKAVYHTLTANITLNSEKLKAFPLRSGTRQGFPLLSLSFNTVIGSHSNRRRKRSKRNPDRKRS